MQQRWSLARGMARNKTGQEREVGGRSSVLYIHCSARCDHSTCPLSCPLHGANHPITRHLTIPKRDWSSVISRGPAAPTFTLARLGTRQRWKVGTVRASKCKWSSAPPAKSKHRHRSGAMAVVRLAIRRGLTQGATPKVTLLSSAIRGHFVAMCYLYARTDTLLYSGRQTSE
jgi:hypothetical protein